MTQEDKQLLLKDLCARLYYVVKALETYYEEVVELICICPRTHNIEAEILSRIGKDNSLTIQNIQFFKPYLRPMSSITEKERIEFSKLLDKRYCDIDWEGHISTSYCIEISSVYTDDENGTKCPSEFSMDAVDWLNAHHFDYRGLIEKGLAIEAPEGMYNTKTE